MNRMLAAHSGVDYGWIRQPDDSEGQMARMYAAMREFANVEGFIRIDDTGGLMASQIVARCRRDHLRNPFALVVIDHIHELRLSGKQGEVIERPEALREFKRMAKELRVPVLCLAQLSRDGGTGDRPSLTSLRGSGGLEEVADTVLLLHRPDYYDQADRPGLIEVIVAKARDGERGVVVNLQNDYRRMRALDYVGPIPVQTTSKPATRWGKKDAA
jgi:replicative DNA helicase